MKNKSMKIMEKDINMFKRYTFIFLIVAVMMLIFCIFTFTILTELEKFVCMALSISSDLMALICFVAWYITRNQYNTLGELITFFGEWDNV
jgi:hypothetical protein